MVEAAVFSSCSSRWRQFNKWQHSKKKRGYRMCSSGYAETDAS
jgi:hypothetical protein